MASEQLDLDDLDEEDLKALAEVKKKGYYHNRPKTEAGPAPERVNAASAAASVEAATGAAVPAVASTAPAPPTKRAEFDEFQRKWDRFDAEERDADSGEGQSSVTRVHRPAPAPASAPAPIVADESVVAQLMSMGFGEVESRAAAIATRNRADAAVNYIVGGGASATVRSRSTQADTEKLALLVEMGFSERHARQALEACQNELDLAVERAAKLASDEAGDRFAGAREALTQLEADVTALESNSSLMPDANRMRVLQEALTQASCNLDAVDVTGTVASREERRAELDRCNVLDNRLASLRSRAAVSQTCAAASTDSAATGEAEPLAVAPPEDSKSTGADGGVAVAESVANAHAGSAAEAAGSAAEATEGADCGGDIAAAAEVVMEKGAPEAAAAPSAPSAAEQRIAKAEELRIAGNNAFKAEDHAGAVREYLAALELDPDNVAILSNLALAELKLGEFEAASAHAAAANDLSGGFSAKALFRQGQALEGLRRFPEAIQAYQSALAVEPSDKLVRQRLQECRKASVPADAPASAAT